MKEGKIIVKQIYCCFICVVLLFSLSACSKTQNQIYMQYSKDGVSEFFKLAQEQIFSQKNSTLDFKEQNCYNVTPSIISEKTKYKIFKFSDNARSYILIDGKVHELGVGIEACGFVNALPCDFDEDGNVDVLFSNVLSPSLSSVVCFNTKTLKASNVVSNSDFNDNRYHVILDAERYAATGKYYFLLTAVGYEINNYKDIFYLNGGTVGEIIVRDKAPIYIEHNSRD